MGLRAAATAAGLMLLAACGPSNEPDAKNTTPLTAQSVDAQAIIDAPDGTWLSHGRTYSEQRFSPLDAVNLETIDELGLAWSAELDTSRGIEATPIVVDGVMYVTSAWSVVYALDAATGERLWTYDPEADRAAGLYACCDVVNRGVALWEGKVFVGTIDGRLIAIDAATGEEIWDVVTVDQSRPYTITGAPRVVKGKVIIGNGGAELGVRGYVTAYDADTGEQVWRFYTVPSADKTPDGEISDAPLAELANDTWDDDGVWTQTGGGGTAWDAMAYDPELDILYIGIGNGTPWSHTLRSPGGGDNLFLSSILAVRPDTGEYVWHYQATPEDNWDYTSTQQITLADLEIDGELRKVALHAPKNGFFYVLDRETGELLSAEPFSAVTWATHVDLETGRPAVVEDATYKNGLALVLPSSGGAHNWHPMAFSPETGLVYIPEQTMPMLFANTENFEYRDGLWNTGVGEPGMDPFAVPDDTATRLAARAAVSGSLLAWDPVAQEARWQVPLGGPWNGGALATAGDLVFQGTMDGRFMAYDAATGEKVWESPAGAGVLSGPVAYEVDGEQYIAVTAGWGSTYVLVAGFAMPVEGAPLLGRVLVFKIGGDAELPETTLSALPKEPQTAAFGDAETVLRGKQNYYQICMWCHGEAAIGGGALPDLRWSPTTADPERWKSIVLDGAYAANGMAGFGEWFTEDDAEAMRAYIVSRAHADAADWELNKP